MKAKTGSAATEKKAAPSSKPDGKKKKVKKPRSMSSLYKSY
jgi:hypothetical protein